MDVRASCPICGLAEVESLPEHLQSHSKQSLIDILLVQHQQIRKPLPSNPTSRVSSRAASSNLLESSDGPLIHQSEDRLSPTSVGHILFELQSSSREGVGRQDDSSKTVPSKKKSQTAAAPVSIVEDQVEFCSRLPTLELSTHIKPGTSKACKAFDRTLKIDNVEALNQSKTNASPAEATFILVDNSIVAPGTSKGKSLPEVALRNIKGESVDAGKNVPNSSIIQYIIDESGQITDAPQEEPDSWILADGRIIPVYSSLHQVPAVTESTPSCTMTVDISGSGLKRSAAENVPAAAPEKPAANNQMHLDLMTDEEIPPRGEISEYEETESNASSILSEDSNLRQHGRGMFSDARRSPALPEQNAFLNRKKRSPPKPLVPQQQYTCHECPQPQIFGSLFELAEHKFESHQSKSLASTTTVTITPSDDNFASDERHILPEKIRRQSQTDELLDPLADAKPSTSEFVAPTSVAQKAKKEYFCVYCDFTTKKRAALAEHMEANHEGKPRVPTMFECTYCGKVFNARTNLRKHLLIHKEKKYSCTTCSKGFTSNFKLIEHMRVHTKTYPYKCTGCDKTYRTPSLLNYHIKTAHLPEGERPAKRKLEFYCSTCYRVLHSKRSYLNHMQLHQEMKPMKCSFCSETFTRHSVLVRHIRVVHDPQYESKESKDCPVCHKKLHPNSMIKHMRIHSNEKPYSCNVCNKYFRTHANLTSHSWSHTNQEKPHKCRLCNKSYLFKKNLENHMMVHKKRTMHFVCNECGVKFTHKVNMKRHLEEHFKEKRHVCKTCGKAFQRHYYLIEHERIHSGVKPFVCNICGKSSTTKSNHRAHLKIHDARETGNQEG